MTRCECSLNRGDRDDPMLKRHCNRELRREVRRILLTTIRGAAVGASMGMVSGLILLDGDATQGTWLGALIILALIGSLPGIAWSAIRGMRLRDEWSST